MLGEEELDKLTLEAGERITQPEDPDFGIYKQKLPSWIRWIIRLIMLPFLWLDLGAQKIAKLIIRPPYVRGGSCLRRGNCCYYILFEKKKGFGSKIMLFWLREINGFYQRSLDSYKVGEKEYLTFGCRHLRKDGKCENHFFRPLICRQWPIVEHFGYPKILKGCGYKIYARK